MKPKQKIVGRRGSAKPGLRLEARDLDICCDLFTYGAMLGEHLLALHFPSRRRRDQRLRQLLDAGLIARKPLPLGLAREASGPPGAIPPVYYLAEAAAPFVAARLGWDVTEVRRLTRLGTPTAIAHTLQVVEIRLRALKAARELGGAVQVAFSPERLVRHSYQVRTAGGQWQVEVFRPDFLLTAAFQGGEPRHFFGEVDLGHTASEKWQARLDVALRYQSGGLFERRYGSATLRTLICTTGQLRKTHLLRLLRRHLDAGDAARFGVATLGDIAQAGLLAAIWQVPGIAGPVSLAQWDKRLF